MPSPTKLTDPLDILVEYGYLDDETPYHKAVSNAVNDFSADQTLGGENNRDYLSILQNEAKKELKLRRKKISASAFKKGSSVGKAQKVAADTTGASALATRKPKVGGDIAQAEDVTPEDQAQPTSALIGPLKSIDSGVNGIIKTLKASNKADVKAKNNARKAAEKKARSEKEGQLEGIKGKLSNAAETVLKPVKNIFSKIWDFLTMVFLGRVVMKLIDWFTNSANQEKVSSLFRFLKDWWPVIVAGIMAVVGPGMIFTAGLIALLAWGIPKIIEAVKWVGSLFGIGVDKELKNIQDESAKFGEETVKEIEKEGVAPKGGQGGNKSRYSSGATESPATDVTPPEVGETQQQAKDVQDGADKVEPLKMAGGGHVPGSGSGDTVPAMLTPGEFVMSKGAVNRYGANTLAGMNAAAGGTNRPRMGGYTGGGEVKSGGPTIHYAQGGMVNSLKGSTNFLNVPQTFISKQPLQFAGGGAVPEAKVVRSSPSTIVINPPSRPNPSVIMEDPVGDAGAKLAARGMPDQEPLPEFDPTHMRSRSKIKTLGIVV